MLLPWGQLCTSTFIADSLVILTEANAEGNSLRRLKLMETFLQGFTLAQGGEWRLKPEFSATSSIVRTWRLLKPKKKLSVCVPAVNMFNLFNGISVKPLPRAESFASVGHSYWQQRRNESANKAKMISNTMTLWFIDRNWFFFLFLSESVSLV